MKNIITVFLFIVPTLIVNAQVIYSKAFGNPNNPPLIYLHGGPGYNSVSFEVTMAQKLSENGFYVISYDRRGEGRSPDNNAKYTFKETFNDLNSIYTKFNLTSATLIGHSFGGIIATLYAEKKPRKVTSIVLVSVPISMQETLATILESSKSIYKNNKDSVNLNYIKILEKMDKKKPTKVAIEMYNKFKTDTLLIKYGSQMTYKAPKGFWKNEKYTSLYISKNIKQVLQYNVPIFGLYGKDDGLFSKTQISDIKNLIGANNLDYLNNCSHHVFIDQQTIFINKLKEWIK